MITLSNILAGAAGLAIVASAAPASAQYASGYNNGYNNGYNQNGGVIGAVINSVLGGGRYGRGADRNAVDQCARAAEARVAREYRPNGYPTGAGAESEGAGQAWRSLYAARLCRATSPAYDHGAAERRLARRAHRCDGGGGHRR
ncbi:MAG TPA: hypothetical protein VKC17_12050 [Sphingomicrobium sp.]|nr:hypothetical protein [Sphingomicrobium sp.]